MKYFTEIIVILFYYMFIIRRMKYLVTKYKIYNINFKENLKSIFFSLSKLLINVPAYIHLPNLKFVTFY